MKLRLEITFDDEGTMTVTGEGLTPTKAAAILAAVGDLGTVEAEEWEEEE